MNTMVTIRITPATALAWNIVPNSATKLRHLTCLLAYHANRNTKCDTVYTGYHGNNGSLPPLFFFFFGLWHGSDFGHQSAPPVNPTSPVNSSATLFLPILGCSKLQFGGSPSWHNIHTKFYSYPSSSFRVEIFGEMDGRMSATLVLPIAENWKVWC
jgi:hypothetical protein